MKAQFIMCILFLLSCTQKSKVKTISSDDWFRNGVDRFYLATLPTQQMYPENSGISVGQDMLVGIGCFAEPKDPATRVAIPSPSCPSRKATIPLNERIRWQDFPMAKDPQRPQAGECVLLLGPEELVQKIQTSAHKFIEEPLSTVTMSNAIATNACGLSLSVGTAFFVQKAVLSKSVTTERDSIRFAQRMLNYFGENNLAPSMYSNQYPIYAVKAQENLQGKDPRQLTRNSKVLIGQSVLPCGVFKKSIWDEIGFVNRNNARKIFFHAMAEADRRAALRVRQGRYFSEFAKAVQQGQLRIAAGIYNPIFAFEFNRNVASKASQGWGGISVQNFFDEIRKINRELLAL
jgi:hypothetical protein